MNKSTELSENANQSHIDEQIDWYLPGRSKDRHETPEETNDTGEPTRFQSVIQKLHIGTTLAALVLFFLPWIDIQCSGNSMVTQSGMQTVYGGGSVSAEMEAFAKKEGGGKSDGTKDKESMGFSILVALALLAVAGAVVLSFKALRSDDERQSNLVGILCAAALMLIAAQMMMGFPVKKEIAKGMAETSEKKSSRNPAEQFGNEMGAAMMSQIQVRHLPALYFELIMLGLPTLVLANGLLDKMKKG